jgi:hypothetical protein
MIFVNIASYRDKELIKTVNSCLSKAKYPENIKIGICWQYDEEEDITALDHISQAYLHKIYWKDVKGSVCWARHLIQQKFFNDEEYYFQVDSHTLFVQDWDEILINMYKELPTDKAVISVGPPYYYDLSAEAALPPESWDENIEEIDGIKYETVIKKQKVDAVGGVHFMYGFIPADDISKPIPARHISAALLFTIGKWVREVPYDPNLYFSGEEATLTLRSYTNGYDIFNPNKFVIYHLKYRFPDRKRHWNTFDPIVVDKLTTINNQKFHQIVNEEDLSIYGIGNKRSLLDWEIYSGVSFKDEVAHPDVFKGIVPNPITIIDLDEWEKIKNKKNGI